MNLDVEALTRLVVVPHAGTWIEIFVAVVVSLDAFVVPHAGTWIEILLAKWIKTADASRSPRGNVD